MRPVLNIIGLIGLAFVLSIGQYFLTGIYGRIMFWPIVGLLLMGYLIKLSLKVNA